MPGYCPVNARLVPGSSGQSLRGGNAGAGQDVPSQVDCMAWAIDKTGSQSGLGAWKLLIGCGLSTLYFFLEVV